MTAPPERRFALRLAAGACLISFAPIFVKLAAGAGMEPTPIAAWRMLIGGALLVPLGLRHRRAFVLARRALALALLAALVLSIDFYMWHRSILIVGAGMATILGNTQVFWTVALGRFLYRERVTRKFGIGVVTAFLGVVLLSGAGSGIAITRRHLIGLALGLGTGLVYAAYLIALKESSRNRPPLATPAKSAVPSPAPIERGTTREHHHAVAMLSWVSLFGAALLFVISAAGGEQLLPPSAAALGYAAALALVVQVLGWLTIFTALSALPASRSALILLLQPMLAALWGAAWFGETLSRTQMLGAVMTLGAVYWQTVQATAKPALPASDPH